MKIVISDKFYIGYNDRGTKDEPCKLGFATYLPLDDTKKQQTAYDKRKSTVDSWADGWGNKKNKYPSEFMDNVLLEGYKIAREVRRYGWNGGNVLWRIEDPRGFELEIASGNMAQILACSTMIDGVIQGKCIWGWTAGKVVLLPEISEPYVDAVKNTQLVQSPNIPLKELNLGDEVTLKNGESGTYLGSMHYVEQGYIEQPYNGGYNWKPSTRKIKFFKQGKNLYTMSSPKVAEVTKRIKKPWTEQEAADIINTCLTKFCTVSSAGGSSVVCVSPKPIKAYHFGLFDSDRKITIGSRHKEHNPLFIRESDMQNLSESSFPLGTLCRVYTAYNGGRVELVRMNEDELINNCQYVTKQVAAKEFGHWRRSNYHESDKFDSTIEALDGVPTQIGALVFEGVQYPPRIY